MRDYTLFLRYNLITFCMVEHVDAIQSIVVKDAIGTIGISFSLSLWQLDIS